MKTTVEIKKLGINGEGIGYIDRKIVFVKGALVDETVEIEITKQNRNYYEGKLLNVIKPSSKRVQPKCRNSKECMGCSLLHMTYGSQLKYKKEAIRESIRKFTNIDLNNVVFKDVIASDKLEGFNQSVNLPIVEFKGKITFGIYQRETKFLTIMTNCYKQHPLINQTLLQIEKILNDNKCKIYSDKFKTGLRFIKVKVIDKKIQVVFICGKDGIKDEVITQISEIPNVASIFMSVNTTKHQEFDQSGYTKLYGNTRLELMHNDKQYLVSVKAKLPDNLDLYFKRNNAIKAMLENSQKIISLNSGLGILELEIDDKEIIAIDENKYYQEDGKQNAKFLSRDNVKFIAGDIDDKIIPYAKKRIYDTVIIQNERFGISDQLKDTLRLGKVENVIYVNESHPTLAKDLNDLSKYYNVEKIVALDTFVYTPYVTTIVKLKRK